MDTWKVVAICVTVAFVSLIGSCTAQNIYEKDAIVRAIESGADPTETVCALRSYVTETYCVATALK